MKTSERKGPIEKRHAAKNSSKVQGWPNFGCLTGGKNERKSRHSSAAAVLVDSVVVSHLKNKGNQQTSMVMARGLLRQVNS